MSASLDARRALAEAQGHAGTARLEADRSAARAEELRARAAALAAAAAEAAAGLVGGDARGREPAAGGRRAPSSELGWRPGWRQPRRPGPRPIARRTRAGRRARPPTSSTTATSSCAPAWRRWSRRLTAARA